MHLFPILQNLNEYFELQLKENVELCKSVLRLTDNRHAARLKIVSLEATITDLTEQLVKAKTVSSFMRLLFLNLIYFIVNWMLKEQNLFSRFPFPSNSLLLRREVFHTISSHLQLISFFNYLFCMLLSSSLKFLCLWQRTLLWNIKYIPNQQRSNW